VISRKGVKKHGQGEFPCQYNSRDLLHVTTYITVALCYNFLRCIAVYHNDNAATFRTFGMQFIKLWFPSGAGLATQNGCCRDDT